MMRMRSVLRFAAVMMAAVILFSAAAAEEEKIAVRVGDLSYTVSEVQQYANKSAMRVESMTGMSLIQLYEENTDVSFLTEAAEHFVTVGMVELKARELELDRLTADEEAALTQYAREYYEALWQQMTDLVEENYPDVSGTDRERVISETMEESGYTLDSLYRECYLALLEQRLADRFCPEITVTDEEAAAFFADTYVRPDRERYENDIALFEQNVLMNGETCYYVPEGYRYIKYIVMNPVSKVSTPVKEAEYALQDAQDALQTAQQALNIAALDTEGTGLETAAAEYQRAEQAVRKAEEDLDACKTAAEAEYLPFRALVGNAMAEGETFDALIERYSVYAEKNTEGFKGYPFHPGSGNWDERMRDAAAALGAEGDLSAPVYVNGGIYLLCRMEDVVCGEYQPDAETLEELKENLLLQKQAEQLDELIAGWKQDVNVVIDISELKMPAAY